MKLQTIDGEPLSREEFKAYLLEVLKMANANKDSFNYPHFLYDLRQKCDMTLEELTGFIHEIQVDQLQNKGLNIQ